MGSRGHAFISHTKALSPKPQAASTEHGPPDHPVIVRPGQRYWPRRGNARVGFSVRRVAGDVAIAARENGDKKSLEIPAATLLARRKDGQGAYHQFIGFRPRKYESHAYVHAVGPEEAILCFPEWHPRRPVSLFISLLPDDARFDGAWLSLSCDLSASSGARLEPHDLALAADPGSERIARPDVWLSRGSG